MNGSHPSAIILSFANTLSPDSGSDLLSTREDAASWLRTEALLPAEVGLSNSEHAALIRLRGAVRDVLAAHTGRREDRDSATRLTKAIADGRLVLTVDTASTVQLASAARASYPNLVAIIAIAIAESAADGTWLRLKSCAAPRCGEAFRDGSPASTGTRCSSHAA